MGGEYLNDSCKVIYYGLRWSIYWYLYHLCVPLFTAQKNHVLNQTLFGNTLSS